MSLTKEQSEKYLEISELTLYVAQAIFERAREEDKNIWANVIKECYDAIEQAISSAIALKDETIPKEHSFKIKKFIRLYDIRDELKNTIYFWFEKRASAHYVDKNEDGTLSVPHELFTEEDAKKSLNETREIIDEIKRLIREGKQNA